MADHQQQDNATDRFWKIDNRWPVFLYHTFINHQQCKYIEIICEQSNADDLMLLKLILRKIINLFNNENYKVPIGIQIKIYSSQSISNR